jgi:hypothetical protein
VIVAQFTNTLPAAPCNNASAPGLKIERIAASSVTTVRITSDAAVTPAGVAGIAAPSSRPTSRARSESVSAMAAIV